MPNPLGTGSVLKDCTDPLYLPFPGQQLRFLDYFHISWSQTFHHFFDFPMDMPQLAWVLLILLFLKNETRFSVCLFFQNHTKLEGTCASLFQNVILLHLLVQPSVFMNTNFQYWLYKKLKIFSDLFDPPPPQISL